MSKEIVFIMRATDVLYSSLATIQIKSNIFLTWEEHFIAFLLKMLHIENFAIYNVPLYDYDDG